MAHKKGQGTSRNGRDSNAQRLGFKAFGGQSFKAADVPKKEAKPKKVKAAAEEESEAKPKAKKKAAPKKAAKKAAKKK